MNTKTQNNVVSAATTTAPTVDYKPSPERVQFELLLTKLVEESNGVPYTDDIKPLVQWACRAAVAKDQCYTTSYGHHGFAWGTKEGRYSITLNKGTNYIYVRFRSYDQLKQQADTRKQFTLDFS